MQNTLRAKSEVKIKAQDGSNVTYIFEKGTDPFEVAKCMLMIHACNVGIVKMHNDMKAFFDQFVKELKEKQNT